MNQIYTYPQNRILGSIVLIIGLIPFAILIKGLLPDLTSAQSLSATIGGILILCFFAFILITIIVGFIYNAYSIVKVTATETGMTIKRIFSTVTVRWQNISEVGRYRVIGAYTRHWIIYFKTRQTGNDKLTVCTNYINNITSLVELLFTKSQNAKFITLMNNSKIPFIKKLEIVSWDIGDEFYF